MKNLGLVLLSVLLLGFGSLKANEKFEIKTIKKGSSIMHLAVQNGKVVSSLEYNIDKEDPELKVNMPDVRGLTMNLYRDGDLIESVKGNNHGPDDYWWVVLVCAEVSVDFGSSGWSVHIGWDCPLAFDTITFTNN